MLANAPHLAVLNGEPDLLFGQRYGLGPVRLDHCPVQRHCRRRSERKDEHEDVGSNTVVQMAKQKRANRGCRERIKRRRPCEQHT